MILKLECSQETVEKEFNIKFCQDDIVGVRLDYIGKMTETICGKV